MFVTKNGYSILRDKTQSNRAVISSKNRDRDEFHVTRQRIAGRKTIGNTRIGATGVNKSKGADGFQIWKTKGGIKGKMRRRMRIGIMRRSKSISRGGR